MRRAIDDELEDLLRAANRGDTLAYARFLEAVAPIVRSVARARGTGLGADVWEDIVQETLLAIHLKRQTWREDAPVRPWLYAIARYKVVDAFRSRGRRVHIQIDDFSESLPAEPGEDPTQSGDVERVLARLDDRSARIVRAIGLNGAEVSETAKTYGMSEAAVRVALHRGLKKIGKLRESMIE